VARTAAGLLIACATLSTAAAQDVTLPNAAGAVKFAVIGDSGTGQRPQYEIGALMALARRQFPFDFVIMLGDNIYGWDRPEDFERKFERPYRALLEAGVMFHAALGNHDKSDSRFYEPWNMGGRRYYAFTKGNVRFFVLYTDDLDFPQRGWLERELRASAEAWKIVYFHEPIYSSAKRHGSNLELRAILEPLFVKYGVNVVFQGHDHVYERTRPQQGVHYFVAGASGRLRRGDLRTTDLTAAGNDREQTFMLVEIADDVLAFQTIDRTGQTVDAGELRRASPPAATPR
jgi:predicted MPP superfamily phosphohydrolase